MIFLRDVVDNKFANIFSTLEFDLSFQNTLTHENTLHAEFLYHWDLYCIVLTNLLEVFVCICLWVSHIVSSLHTLKERIFVFMYILNLFFFLFFSLVCVSLYFSPPPKFSRNCFFQNLFYFSYFYRRGVASIFYRAYLFYVSLILYFLLTSVVYVFCIPSEYHVEKVFSYFYFRGGWNCFWKVEKIKYFDVSNLGGELVCLWFYISLVVFNKVDIKLFALWFTMHYSFCLSVFISTHALMCSFKCFRKDMYTPIKTFCLFLQLLGKKY